MKRWWKRLAVVAAWLGVSAAAHAQGGGGVMPSPVGAARMPEPLRYNPGPQPELVPTALTPQIAPGGPPPELDLPASHSSAFQFENYSNEAGFYFHLGGMALRRYRNGVNGPSVFLDQTNNLDTGVAPVFRLLPVTANTGDIEPNYHGGGRVSLGYLCCNTAWEFNAFYLPEAVDRLERNDPGRLNLQFAGNGGSFPLGFEGNNGLFLQADRVVLKFENEIGGAEVLHRTWNSGVNGVDLLIGARYLHLRERLGIFVDDEAQFVALDSGLSDPRRQAEYSSQILTRFLGLTFGGEYSFPLITNRVWLTSLGKVSLGVNDIQRRLALDRGDNAEAFDIKTERYRFGQLYDYTLGLDFHVLEKARLRLAYQAMWLIGTTTPAAQVDLNFSTQGTRPFGYRDVFYHGPQLEFQMLF